MSEPSNDNNLEECKDGTITRKKYTRNNKRHLTCPVSNSILVFAEDTPEKSQFLQVPNPNLLYPPTQKDFKSVSLGELSSESIGTDENSSIKFPLKPKSPNRLTKKNKPPLSPAMLPGSPVCFERKDQRSKTLIGGKGGKTGENEGKDKKVDKKTLIAFSDSPKGFEEGKCEFKEKREVYWNSSGDSTPHLYVDYKQRLNGILLVHFAEDNEEIESVSSESD